MVIRELRHVGDVLFGGSRSNWERYVCTALIRHKTYNCLTVNTNTICVQLKTNLHLQ